MLQMVSRARFEFCGGWKRTSRCKLRHFQCVYSPLVSPVRCWVPGCVVLPFLRLSWTKDALVLGCSTNHALLISSFLKYLYDFIKPQLGTVPFLSVLHVLLLHGVERLVLQSVDARTSQRQLSTWPTWCMFSLWGWPGKVSPLTQKVKIIISKLNIFINTWDLLFMPCEFPCSFGKI